MGLFRSKKRSSSSPVPVPPNLPSPPSSRSTRTKRSTTTSTVSKRGRTVGNSNSHGNGHISTTKLPSVPKVIEEEESTEGTKAIANSKKTDAAIEKTPTSNKLAPREESTVGTERVNKLPTQNSDVSNPLSVSFAAGTKDTSLLRSNVTGPTTNNRNVITDQPNEEIRSIPKIITTSSPASSDKHLSNNNNNNVIEDEADQLAALEKERFRSKTVSEADRNRGSGIVHSNSVWSLPGAVQANIEPMTSAIKVPKPVVNISKHYDKTLGKSIQQTSNKMLEPPQAAISGAVKLVKPILPTILTSKSETNLASLSMTTPVSFSPSNGNANANNDNNNVFVSNINDSTVSASIQDHVKLSGITYASARRDYTFHNFFKDIPQSERLIDDFSCVMHGDMPIKGRMYVTSRNIFFYSNILTYITDVKIPFMEIVQIQKKSIAGFIPNSIVIDTLSSKYIFASFLSRDIIYNLLISIWGQYEVVRSSGGDARVMHSNSSKNTVSSNSQSDDDDDYLISDLDTDESEDSSQDSSSSGDEEEDEDEDDDRAISIATSEHSRLRRGRGRKRASSRATTATSVSRRSTGSSMHGKGDQVTSGDLNGVPGPTKHSPTTPTFQPKDFEKLINESVFHAPMGQVVNYLFGPDTEYLKKILIKQKNFDLSEIPGTLLQNKSRDYTYMKPISGSIGPSKTRCLITEIVDNYDLDNTVQVTQLTKNPDVPSGNVFQTRTTFVFHWDAKNTTKMLVYVGVEWFGKSWIKSAINKGTIDGVTDATRILASELQDFIQADTSATPSLRSKRKQRRKETEEEEDEEEEGNGTGYNLPSREPFKHAPTEANIVLGKNDTVIKQNVVFQCPLGTLYQLLFGDNTSYLKDLVAKQNNFDISDIPGFKAKRRDYTYTKRLNNSIGPKQTKCSITETLENDDMNSYIHVKQISKTPDVPSGNSFYVQTSFYLSWGGNNTTKMSVVTNVVWTGKSLLKGAIERGSIEGQAGTTEILIREVNKILSSTRITRKKNKGKKGKRSGRSDTMRSKNEEEITEVTTTHLSENNTEIVSGTLFKWIPITFDHIQSRFFDSLVNPLIEFDFTSVRFFTAILLWFTIILSIIRCITILPTWYTSITSHSRTVSILAPGKIIIDGYEYNYAPSFKTLYGFYEDEVINGESDILFDSERAIWDWIEDRAGLTTRLSSNPDSNPDSCSCANPYVGIGSNAIQNRGFDDYSAARHADIGSPSKKRSKSGRVSKDVANDVGNTDTEGSIEHLREVLRVANLRLAEMQKLVDELQGRASAAI